MLEIYDIEMVERMFPYQKKLMFPFENQEMVSDEDLEKAGLSFNNSDLYSMPDELIYKSYHKP